MNITSIDPSINLLIHPLICPFIYIYLFIQLSNQSVQLHHSFLLHLHIYQCSADQCCSKYVCLGREKLLSQKFAVTSQFVVSTKVWARTIPTRNCDVLMTFPAQTDDDTLMWVLARLRARVPELCVHVRHHSNTGVYGFYLTASYEQ